MLLDIKERSCYFSCMTSALALSKGAVTRGSIVDRAVTLVRAGGFEALSIGGVALAAGMSKSGVFAHFGSREELQLAVLDAAAQRFTDDVFVPALRAPRGLERLQSIASHWLDWLRDSVGGCPMISAAIEYDDKPGPVRDRVALYEKRLRKALVHAVNLTVETGEFRADTDTEQVAFELFGIALATHHDYRLLGDPRTGKRSAVALNRLFDWYRS
jgi:AcrR family transcriptional regulator